MSARRVGLLGLLAALLAGCGSGSTTTRSSSTVTGPVPTMTLTVIRVSNDLLRAEAVLVPQTRAVAAAALEQLGIDAGVQIANGTATVDLDHAGRELTAEIVCTLTQFPAVQRVDVAGEHGLVCSDFEPLLPAIFITSPGAGAHVPSEFPVRGTASVFEATFQLELREGGKVVDRRTVTASEGAPGRGTFATTLHGPSGPATIHAFAPSAANGTPQHVVDVPVTVE